MRPHLPGPTTSYSQVLELLAHHLAQWSCSPALPELAHLPVLQLRRFAKVTRVDRFRRAAKSLLEVIDRWVGAGQGDVPGIGGGVCAPSSIQVGTQLTGSQQRL
jgi:hypothetical protein